MASISTVRFYTFPDLATANASLQPFRHNTIIRIEGDNTQYKIGDGDCFGQGSTFAQLPWIKTSAAVSNTPFATQAFNATGTITAAQLLNKFITSTTAAAVTLTLPTATLLGTALGAVLGTEFTFTVYNSGGTNTLTVATGTGITVPTAVLTGSDTLTVAPGVFGKFSITFKSATVAVLKRIS